VKTIDLITLALGGTLGSLAGCGSAAPSAGDDASSGASTERPCFDLERNGMRVCQRAVSI